MTAIDKSSLSVLLQNYPYFYEPIEGCRQKHRIKWLDFTAANEAWLAVDLTDTQAFDRYLQAYYLDHGKYIGVGGYNEHRSIYARSTHFGTAESEARCIHLGVDLWGPAGTPVRLPLEGRVHSLADNDHFGDYGPTIIIEHEYSGRSFYTLYGHLSRSSLTDLEIGQTLRAGEGFAVVGPWPENGHWPPHLHFQLIEEIGRSQGDYPGVCRVSERAAYLANCPDPDLILRLPVEK